MTGSTRDESHVSNLDLDWDYVHSRRTVSDDVLHSLSRVMAKSESIVSIYDTSVVMPDPEREIFRLLGQEVGLLLQLLEDPRLDSSTAKVVEDLVHSQKHTILSFCTHNERPGLAKVPYDSIVHMVDQLLKLSGAAPFRNRAEQSTKGAIKADDRGVDGIMNRMNNHCLTQSVKHQAFHDALCSGTFTWFFNDRIYTDWRNTLGAPNHDRILKIQGNPGCGKTMLCSAVIDDLKNSYEGLSGAVVAYYYCPSRDFSRTKAYEVILSLVVQTYVGLSIIPDRTRDLYEKIQASDNSDDVLAAHIADVVSLRAPTCFIIDGLDQVLDSPRVMNWLFTVLEHCSNIKCMLTYRMTYLLSATWMHKGPVFIFDGGNVNSDIDVVVDQGLQAMDLTPRLQTLIKGKIQRQAHGM